MKIRRRETLGRSHKPCWSPNRRRAMRQRVSSPDCAVDERPHSRREQDRLLAAPSVSAGTLDCARARWQALSRAMPGLTVNEPDWRFRQFFVSPNGSASGRSNGGSKFRSANAVRIGANDARHREHLMAPARQLTSSASLKGNGCREIRLLEVRRLVARVTLRLSRIN